MSDDSHRCVADLLFHGHKPDDPPAAFAPCHAPAVMPGPEGDEVHVWQACGSRPPDSAGIAAILDDREMERYRRFHRPEDAGRYGFAHVTLRNVLASYLGTDPGALAFGHGPYGKPRMSIIMGTDLRFNMAHSGDIVLIAIARGREVGVDVERVDASYPFMDTARSYFSEKEYALLLAAPADQRPETFFTLWTRKEACIKAAGKGLHMPLSAVDLSGQGLNSDRQEVVVDGARYTVAGLKPLPEYLGAVAVEGPLSAVRLRVWPGTR
ncbi:MAG: holo-(acyl carrier protein) synthase 2 [Methanocella sp. PtaU1.Bin125]|nr:MAG: holo-(acyl carrier protein) synthase 2 [Methanocella sp. PtaU1.Bin125]